MPRLQKVFKKRKGKYYPRKNTINSKVSTTDSKLNAQAEHAHDSKQSCAKEKKIPNLNESFSFFGDSVVILNAIMNLNILAFVFKNEVHCKMCNSGLDMQVLKGAEAGRMFCGVMNLPQPHTRFSPYGKRILNAAKLVYEDSIQNAAKEAICENEGNKNIAVAVDGTWQKRGYTSLNGVVTVTRASIQSYYGSAIRRNHSSVQNMRQAIWAIFLHKLSTDEYPQHGFCPIGEDSWCGFKKAEASGKSYKHKNSLPVAVVEVMCPILRDLSHPDLLKKCLHGKTQNSNESFHNVIWSRVPKVTFVQIETLSLGVYDAVCSFNDGNVLKLKMLQKMGVEPGEFSVSAMKLLDRERLMKAIYAFSGRSKKIIKDKRRKRKIEDNIKKNKVKTSYSEGSF
ncbi:uncharacterized protein TNCV_3930461 [Trichonephila clavipes]|nr:uncharacterized protein TNCV_3930461 [Trichonephila clavipes]